MPTKKSSSKSKKATSKAVNATRARKKTTPKKTVAKKGATKSKKEPVKKATSKKTPKKMAPKLREKVLVCADAQNCFWTTDGQVLKDLNELQTALSAMATDVFNHHVTKEKNDFADWVEHVLLDAECAKALRRSKKPNSARTVVVRHLKLYSTE